MASKKETQARRQSNKAASIYLKLKGEVFNMAKIGTQKTIEVEGIEYTLQHPGTREYTRIMDRATNDNGIPSSEKLADEVFKHVVNPKVSLEYFDEHDGYEDVFKEA